MDGTAAMAVESSTSIHDVDPDGWDSLNKAGDLLHSHRFYRSLEDARLPGSRFWYLRFYARDELVATAVLSAYPVCLDLLLGPGWRRATAGVRRVLPRFLRLEVLFCGVPVSLGQKSLAIKDPSFSGAVLRRLAHEMGRIGRAHGIRFFCAKEFADTEWSVLDGLAECGFFRAASLPYVSMEIRWDGFAAYLEALRHPYRRAILQPLRRLCGGPVPGPPAAPCGPHLEIRTAQGCPPERIHQLYAQVMDRAAAKLEILNPAFFAYLLANLKEEVELLCLVADGRVHGVAVLAIADGVMSFLFVGMDYATRDRFATYFNLLHGIIARAIDRGCHRLNLGQTSYWAKLRLGGRCSPRSFYFKAQNPLTHRLLRAGRAVLFPEVLPRVPQVFKGATACAAGRAGEGSRG